jgi:hypothetical protein
MPGCSPRVTRSPSPPEFRPWTSSFRRETCARCSLSRASPRTTAASVRPEGGRRRLPGRGRSRRAVQPCGRARGRPGHRPLRLRPRRPAERLHRDVARPRLTGILLVGGASTRFGSPKALATFHGETLAERAWRLLGEACDERLAVGKRQMRSSCRSSSWTTTPRSAQPSPGSWPVCVRRLPSVRSYSRSTCPSSRPRSCAGSVRRVPTPPLPRWARSLLPLPPGHCPRSNAASPRAGWRSTRRWPNSPPGESTLTRTCSRM